MAHSSPNNIRMVLMGGKQSGKTSVINTICGGNSTGATARCQKTEATVNGLELTLVDTPGYWRDLFLRDTARFIKHELMLSLALCPPGPHAVVLVVELDIPFTDEIRCVIQEHVELLGVDVWKHAIILFTRRQSIESEGVTIQQHVEREDQALRWLVNKCERRYHCFENEDQDSNQVTVLLKKILDMAAKGGHFEPDWGKLKEIEERRAMVIERALDRQARVKQQRERIQNEGEMLHLSEVRFVIVGWVFSGKSAAANTLLSNNGFPTSCWTETSETRSEMVEGRQISVTDTPGWFKYFPVHYTSSQVSSEIKKALTLGPKRPHAILLVVPLGVSFLEDQRKIMRDNMEWRFGEDIWRHTIVLFTWGDLLVNMSIEEHIESEGEPLRWLVEKCRNRYHVFNNVDGEDHLQVTTLLERVEEMVKDNHLFTPFMRELQVNSRADSDTKPGSSYGQDANIKDALQSLTAKWKRDDEEMERFIHEEVKCGSNTHHPPNMEDEQSASRDIESLCDPIKESLKRETARRDCIKIKRILDLIESKRMSSECDPTDIHMSRQKVLRWKTESGYESCLPTEEFESIAEEEKEKRGSKEILTNLTKEHGK